MMKKFMQISFYKACFMMMTVMLMGCTTLSTTMYQSDGWQPVSISNSYEKVIHSNFTHKDHLIQVAKIGNQPKNGYAVVYVLDGNAFFSPSVSIAQMLQGRPSETNPKSLLVVGIGYNTGRRLDVFNRTHDYTPPAASYPAPNGEQVKFGGANMLYQFITQELTPILDDEFGINSRHRTLIGHSYGGLFGLYSLLNHGDGFDHYLIASPSIWWNDKSIYEYKAGFMPASNVGNVIITLGEQELNAKRHNPNAPTTDLQGSDAYQTMLFLKDNLPNAKVDFHFNLGQSHGLNAYPSMIQGIKMAYDACRLDTTC
ncbi:alpha/beta hydrolase [Moraxella catarrhalis]|nr:alpha/beta hydrolase [Moraxella catarrhalis]